MSSLPSKIYFELPWLIELICENTRLQFHSKLTFFFGQQKLMVSGLKKSMIFTSIMQIF